MRRFRQLTIASIAGAVALAGCGGSSKPTRTTATTNSTNSQKASACAGATTQYLTLASDASSAGKTIQSSSDAGPPSDTAPFDKLVADVATLKTAFSELRSTATASQQAQIDQYQSALDSLTQAAKAYAVGDYTTGNSDFVGVNAQVQPMGQLITALCGRP